MRISLLKVLFLNQIPIRTYNTEISNTGTFNTKTYNAVVQICNTVTTSKSGHHGKDPAFKSELLFYLILRELPYTLNHQYANIQLISHWNCE